MDYVIKVRHGWLLLVAVALLGCGQQEAPTELAAANTVVEVAEPERLIPLEGGRNFRDLGGYTTTDGRSVKWGKLYRSGALVSLTDADYEALADREIATIVDFRATAEREQEPTNWRAGNPEQLAWNYELDFGTEKFVKLLSNPETTTQDIDNLMAESYPSLLDSQSLAYRTMFDRLVEGQEPLLFHCSAGKDRTGIAAAMILTTLGVEREQVIADYELSNRYFQPSLGNMTEEEKKALNLPPIPEGLANMMLGVRSAWLETAFKAMEAKSGSVLAYIQQELDVSNEEIEKLKARYLEN